MFHAYLPDSNHMKYEIGYIQGQTKDIICKKGCHWLTIRERMALFASILILIIILPFSLKIKFKRVLFYSNL